VRKFAGTCNLSHPPPGEAAIRGSPALRSPALAAGIIPWIAEQ
jgi:hypothetical protein